MEKKIPTYRIVVNSDDDTTGVYAVSLVDEPAIEVDWIKLSKQIEEFEFSINKDKQMLFGPLLIPNKLIYRMDEKGNGYNIVFDEDTIQTIADKYNENKLGDVFNFQHSDKKVEAVLLQNWITGEVDKSNEWGFSLPKGTWFGGVKVKDEGFWMNEIKTEKVKGFSVEIMAGTELIEMTAQADKNKKIDLMEYKTKDGLTLTWEGDAAVGKEIFIILEDGSNAPLSNGTYELEDGTRIIAADGKVAEIIAADAEEMAEAVVEAPVTPTTEGTDILSVVEPIFNELRNVIAELTTRLDKLENVETVAEETEADSEMLSKVKVLEEKIEMLSSMAGAKSITVKNDRETERETQKENNEKRMIERLEFFKKSTK
jgi:hypothetical protein